MTQMTPKQIVEQLDQFIIGQAKAKKAVAIALRNRWRRMQLDPPFRQEVSPKNILMIGPTGVGKTEIARRMAKLAHAPFIKVEATKFTEVGYVGKDVDSIIRDLTDVALKMVRQDQVESIKPKAQAIAEEKVLDALLPPACADLSKFDRGETASSGQSSNTEEPSSGLRELFRKKLREGKLDDREIDVPIGASSIGIEIISPPGMEDMTLQALFQNLSNLRQRKRKMKVSEAMHAIIEEESNKLVNPEEAKQKTIELVEQTGIVFIDEIDKITNDGNKAHRSEISREGVQRDLLPLIEGCSVTTKHGMVKTDHILFIASGAFQLTSPSDLVPELQGRLPIRVELDALSGQDFERILTEPHASLTKQYQALMRTEGVEVEFTESGIKRIAEVAWKVNDQSENIGARRLYTVLESLMEEVSFNADQQSGATVVIDQDYVDQRLDDLIKKEDLSKFVL